MPIKSHHFIMLVKSLFVSVLLTANSMAATVSGGAGGITLLQLPADYSSVQLQGEDGTNLSSKNGNFKMAEGFKDGRYSYVIWAEVAVKQSFEVNEFADNNGRDINAKPAASVMKPIESKSFLIMDGQVVNPDLKEEK